MSKFLYGAAVQGIQDFIFRTNELQHIVGASELVEEICTDAFDYGGTVVVKAAGNVKCIFDCEDDCNRAVREFPKKVMTLAPGITISQAVVEYAGTSMAFQAAVNELEANLKIQRNKPSRSVLLGLMGIKHANNTGLPVVEVRKDKDGDVYYLDEATKAKLSKNSIFRLCQKSFGCKDLKAHNIAFDISHICGQNDWIAIIHADGNGLGQVVQKVGREPDVFRAFSRNLNQATIEAAQMAYNVVKAQFNEDEVIPIRPVVLNGDDMTVIIRGCLAIAYADAFIRAFEEKTAEYLKDDHGENILTKYGVFQGGENYLTACAGIAFIKSSYPFYYGYQLAEELCGQAKKDTKAIAGEGFLPASCLMFHKVQDSFITTYEDIVRRELTAVDGISFKAGPYYTKEMANRYTVADVTDIEGLDSESGVKSSLRNWLSIRLKDKARADLRLERMRQIFVNRNDLSTINRLTKEPRPLAYDILVCHTVINQKTK